LSASIRASLITVEVPGLEFAIGGSDMKNSAKKNLAPGAGDEFLTTEESAKRLKRSAKTLEYWRTAGLGPPFYRQQRSVCYLASEILAWGVSCRVAPQNTGD
jgi:hypothetical protein